MLKSVIGPEETETNVYKKTDNKMQVDIQIMLPHVLFITIYFYNIYIYNDNTGCRNNQREGSTTHVLSYLFYIIIYLPFITSAYIK